MNFASRGMIAWFGVRVELRKIFARTPDTYTSVPRFDRAGVWSDSSPMSRGFRPVLS